MSVDDPGFELLRERLAARGPSVVEGVEGVRAAVAVILVPGDAGTDLLLIRRAEFEGDPWSGHMGLPGGRMDPGDADLLQTARRETREELSVELSELALLGRLDDLHPISTRLPRIVVRPFVFGLSQRPVVEPNHEVAYHLWAPLTELSANRGRTVVPHLGEPREMPSFALGEDVVWGMTHRILEPLVELFE